MFPTRQPTKQAVVKWIETRCVKLRISIDTLSTSTLWTAHVVTGNRNDNLYHPDTALGSGSGTSVYFTVRNEKSRNQKCKQYINLKSSGGLGREYACFFFLGASSKVVRKTRFFPEKPNRTGFFTGYFLKKGMSSRELPFFLFLPEWKENQCTIFFSQHFLCSLIKGVQSGGKFDGTFLITERFSNAEHSVGKLHRTFLITGGFLNTVKCLTLIPSYFV